jgi:VIT family
VARNVSSKSSRRVLEPIDRVSEALFGLIMVLTFTGSLSVADAGRDDVRAMLIGALGCNLAWGIIDAVFYLMACLADKGQGIRTLLDARRTTDAQHARQLVANALPATVASVMQPSELDAIHRRLAQLPEPPPSARLGKEDWWGAWESFWWVFLTTFPVAIPFIFMKSVLPAMRVSNAIAIVLLFITGWAFGRISGYRPWLVGMAVVVFGILLVGMTIALGG